MQRGRKRGSRGEPRTLLEGRRRVGLQLAGRLIWRRHNRRAVRHHPGEGRAPAQQRPARTPTTPAAPARPVPAPGAAG